MLACANELMAMIPILKEEAVFTLLQRVPLAPPPPVSLSSSSRSHGRRTNGGRTQSLGLGDITEEEEEGVFQMRSSRGRKKEDE